MKMFMLKSFCILALMVLFVLVGMKTANHGIHEINGNSDANLKSDLSLLKPDLHTSIGYDRFSHNINKKKQELEKMNSFNFFSFMGNELSDGLTHISKKMLTLVAK